jgi:hypothetical protein
MGIRDTVRNMLGLGEPQQPDEVAAPPVSEMLAPTRVMENAWRKAAREDSHEYGDLTRAALGREFGSRWFAEPLPADREERRAAIEESLVTRSRGLYAEHVERVQEMFGLPDDEVRSSLMVDVGDLPGRDRPEERALHLSSAIISEDSLGREMDLQARHAQEEYRMSPPSFSDWAEHKAGEPGILAAERNGDWEHVDHGRKAYYDSFQLKDPTLREIAMTAVDKADRWSQVDAAELASGQVRLSEATAQGLVSSAATYEPGRRRDAAIVEAYLDDYAARNPKVVGDWNRQALEVMAEGPAFMSARYGGVETGGMSVRQVVSLEAMWEVTTVRIDQDTDRAMDVLVGRDRLLAKADPEKMPGHAKGVQMSALGGG